MKTLLTGCVCLAGLAALPAAGQDLQRQALQRAEQAHSAAAHLAAVTLPFAECGPDWNDVSRHAVAADNAAAAVQAALAACDFCAARDAAEALDDIADDLQEGIDELEPVAAPVPRRVARLEMRQLDELAAILEEISGDLKRDTRRLDKAQDRPAGAIVPPYAVGPLPAGPPVMGRPYRPGRVRGYGPGPYPVPNVSDGYGPEYGYGYGGGPGGADTFGGQPPGVYGTPVPGSLEPVPAEAQPIPRRVDPITPEVAPRSNYGPPMTNYRPSPRPNRPNTSGSLGPGLSTPPSDAFGPIPDEIPAAPIPSEATPSEPVPSGPRLDGNVTPTAGSEPQGDEPGLSRQSVPGRLQTIPQRPKSNGPALLAPSADADADADADTITR